MWSDERVVGPRRWQLWENICVVLLHARVLTSRSPALPLSPLSLPARDGPHRTALIFRPLNPPRAKRTSEQSNPSKSVPMPHPTQINCLVCNQ